MAVFQIEQYELPTQTYVAEADNEAEAISKLLNGEGEPLDGTLEFIQITEDRGLRLSSLGELSDELRAGNIPVCDGFVPSIRAISLMKTAN